MSWQILTGDSLETLRTLPDESVQCCVTSPPYWGLRDYGVDGQIGLEPTPEEHVAKLVDLFREVRRVLRADGTLWVNYGDAYAANRTYQVPDSKHCDVGNGSGMRVPAGLKPKDLIGLPWMLAFALRDDGVADRRALEALDRARTAILDAYKWPAIPDRAIAALERLSEEYASAKGHGWWLRSDIVWHKPNPMPESVTDRPTRAHEYVFLLSKSARYFYDLEAVREPGTGKRPGNTTHKQSCMGGTKAGLCNIKAAEHRNARTVWTINPQPFAEAHFATFPEALAERCIKAGSRRGDTVLDPFAGSGTTLLVAERLGRNGIGIELNPDYVEIAKRRIAKADPMAPVVVKGGAVQNSLFHS